MRKAETNFELYWIQGFVHTDLLAVVNLTVQELAMVAPIAVLSKESLEPHTQESQRYKHMFDPLYVCASTAKWWHYICSIILGKQNGVFPMLLA